MTDTRSFEKLVLDCMMYADDKGTIIQKYSTHRSSVLEMSFEKDDIRVWFRANAKATGNGSCDIQVHKNTELVLHAIGSFMTQPFNVKEKTFIQGDWIDKIPTNPWKAK